MIDPIAFEAAAVVLRDADAELAEAQRVLDDARKVCEAAAKTQAGARAVLLRMAEAAAGTRIA